MENSLHAGMKEYLQLPGDKIESPVARYIIDIVRENTLFEIQTRNFYALRPKLVDLLPLYPVHVIYPLAVQKWIQRLNQDKSVTRKRRKSPKHASVYHVFNELVYLSELLGHPNLCVDIYLVEQEDIWLNDGKGSWRRKGWSLYDQKLLKVTDKVTLQSKIDYLNLLPQDLPAQFRNTDLARTASITVGLARKMTYTLSKSGLLAQTGKQGRSNLFTRLDQMDTLNPGTPAGG